MAIGKSGLLAAVSALLIAGCATPIGFDSRVRPPGGALVTNHKAPLTLDFVGNPAGNRARKASWSHTSYFWDIILTGGTYAFDKAHIAKIARDGGINEVSYADYEFLSVLGVFQKMTVNVYGN